MYDIIYVRDIFRCHTKVEYQLHILHLYMSHHFHFIISFNAANVFHIAYCARRFDPR